MGFFKRLKAGLTRSSTSFQERMNIVLDRGPVVDDEFWDDLEETLILSDVGAVAADEIVSNLRDEATRQALPDAYAVMDRLSDTIAATFPPTETDMFIGPRTVLFVGINGTGKTTTVGKIANEAKAAGQRVLIGCADTFRAAAIEQLEVWATRADVEIVERERGSDPASVCYATIERAEEIGADLVLIDTAGRLHTSNDLMRELRKVVDVVRKRSSLPVSVILVIDATTGQNGLTQAKAFNDALDLDALIVTKLDGTAKGGIVIAIANELGLPIVRIGVGEGMQDLQDFDARQFADALLGRESSYDDEDDDDDYGDDFDDDEETGIEEDYGDDVEDVRGGEEDVADEDDDESDEIEDIFDDEPDETDEPDTEVVPEEAEIPDDDSDEAAIEEAADEDEEETEGDEAGFDDDEDLIGDEWMLGADDAEASMATDEAEEEEPAKKSFWRRLF